MPLTMRLPLVNTNPVLHNPVITIIGIKMVMDISMRTIRI